MQETQMLQRHEPDPEPAAKPVPNQLPNQLETNCQTSSQPIAKPVPNQLPNQFQTSCQTNSQPAAKPVPNQLPNQLQTSCQTSSKPAPDQLPNQLKTSSLASWPRPLYRPPLGEVRGTPGGGESVRPLANSPPGGDHAKGCERTQPEGLGPLQNDSPTRPSRDYEHTLRAQGTVADSAGLWS